MHADRENEMHDEQTEEKNNTIVDRESDSRNTGKMTDQKWHSNKLTDNKFNRQDTNMRKKRQWNDSAKQRWCDKLKKIYYCKQGKLTYR